MRITGGHFRGRMLAAPSDAHVRPTSDKVRQAVFNILAHNDFGIGFVLEGARVVDVFAGTGAMGIEALSRGASYCLFIDNAAGSRALLRTNVESFALTGATKIWRRDGSKPGSMPPGAGGPFNLTFLDPPYRKKLIAPALAALRDGGWLAPQALIVAERAVDEDVTAAENVLLLDSRAYGDTTVDFLAFDSLQK
ncbi:MAG: 16S rRNA (guanine(966)-N(2))-methyltransferase RsmD [Rhizomicrobium sp.]